MTRTETREKPAANSRHGYRQVAAILSEEIRGGAWKIGAQLPTEHDLVERFGVSRNTIREALRELQNYGYLGKRRGMRSVVLSTSASDIFINSVRSLEELLEYAHASHNRLLSAETMILMEDQAKQLNCRVRSEWMRFQVLRSREAGGRPYCYSEIYVMPDYADVRDFVRDDLPVYASIEKRYGITISRAVQDINATAASENIALLLQVNPGDPILTRRTSFFRDNGELVEIGIAHFLPNHYHLSITLDRRRQDTAPR